MMFNNLIESSSHRKEFKRRGSFLLFTTGTYVLLFVITGVASIYAYDANLGDQSYEVVTMLPPVDIATPPKPAAPATPSSAQHGNQTVDVLRNPTASVNEATLVPKDISAKQNPELPVRRGVPYVVGPTNSYADLPGTRTTGNTSSTSNVRVDIDDPPPAPAATPAPAPPKIVKVSTVLNGRAIYLPKPMYPALARQAHLQGAVNIQVLIDETGKVISAKAVSGHPLFVMEAQRAAMQARFSPTLIGETAVKISGVIVYNFVLQ